MGEKTGHRQLPLFPTSGRRPDTPLSAAPTAALGPDSSLGLAAAAFDEHLARAGKTENTRKAFLSDLRLLGRYIGFDKALREITTSDLEQFLSWMLEHRSRPCSAKTYARRLSTLKSIFAWLVECGALSHDPAATLMHRHAESPLPRVLTDEQVERLLALAERIARDAGDYRPALMLRLLLDTGLKKGELVRLRLDDISWDTDPPTLLVRYDSPRWKAKERRIAYSSVVRRHLSAYRTRYAPSDNLFECTARNLEYVLADLVEAADLPRGTSFETIRWTSALRSYRAGVEPEALRTKLGLSPVTWAETKRKLALLAEGVGPTGRTLGEFFREPRRAAFEAEP